MIRHVILTAALLPALLVGAEPAAPAASFYLLTDYLPPLTYEGDPVTACFRIENIEGSEATILATITVLDGVGATLRETTERINPAAKGFTDFQRSLDTRNVGGIRFTFRRSGTTEKVSIQFQHDGDPWPETRVASGRMVLAKSGDVLIPIVQKRQVRQERAYASMKWILKPQEGAPGRQRLTLGFLQSDGAPQAPKKKTDEPRMPVVALTVPPPNGAPPILDTLDQVVRAVAKRKADGEPVTRAVLLLPPDDFRVTTERRVYRMAVDGLLARLEHLQVGQTVLVLPFLFGIGDGERDLLWHEVQESAAAYGAKIVYPDWVDEKVWRLDPDVEGVYGRQPNALGQKMIEQGLANLLP